MPNITYRQLTSYINELKKNNKSTDTSFRLLISQTEALSKLIHDNQNLTTQNERQDIYGDIREYIDAYDKSFHGNPNNATRGDELNNINAIGERLSTKLTALGHKPQNVLFKVNADDFVTNIANNNRAMNDSIMIRDIDRYTKNSYIALDNANKLANDKKLDAQTTDLINQLNANLLAVTNNAVISLETRHRAARSISHILYFYNEHLFDPRCKKQNKHPSTA